MFNSRDLELALASRDFYEDEYLRCYMRYEDRHCSYGAKRQESQAWMAYQAACDKVARLCADRDGICYNQIKWRNTNAPCSRIGKPRNKLIDAHLRCGMTIANERNAFFNSYECAWAYQAGRRSGDYNYHEPLAWVAE